MEIGDELFKEAEKAVEMRDKAHFLSTLSSALVIAQRQNCAQVVVHDPRRRLMVEAATKANQLLAFAIAWPDGRIKIIPEVK